MLKSTGYSRIFATKVEGYCMEVSVVFCGSLWRTIYITVLLQYNIVNLKGVRGEMKVEGGNGVQCGIQTHKLPHLSSGHARPAFSAELRFKA